MRIEWRACEWIGRYSIYMCMYDVAIQKNFVSTALHAFYEVEQLCFYTSKITGCIVGTTSRAVTL